MARAGSLSVAPAVDVTAVVTIGAVPAAWLAIAAVLIVQGVVRRRPAERTIFQAGLATVCILVANGVLSWVGGAAALGAAGGWSAWLIAFATVAAYLLVATSLFSIMIGGELGLAPRRVWEASFAGAWLYAIALPPLVVGTAWAYRAWGAAALVWMVPPLCIARQALTARVERRRAAEDAAVALVETLGAVDPYTRAHSIRVAVYAEAIARRLELPEAQVDEVRFGALLHDLGKVGQDRQVLAKPGSLTDAERHAMRRHPRAGARIVGCVAAFGSVVDIVHHHHERFDGGGYPSGLAGDAIPLAARIVLVADALDAMTSDRSYRRGMPLVIAIGEIERHAGRQFDAVVVAALGELVASGELRVLRGDVEPAIAFARSVV